MADTMIVTQADVDAADDWLERYENDLVLLEGSDLSEAFARHRERLTKALQEIAEITHRQQLPITAQVHAIAMEAIKP